VLLYNIEKNKRKEEEKAQKRKIPLLEINKKT